MKKTLLALGVASTLVLAPALAFADEATTPPSPNAPSTPGNGPPKMHHHPHHHHHHHSMENMDKPAEAPK